MASLADNVARVVNGLDNIKKTITDNGCVVSPDTPIESYPELIDNACALNSEQGYNKGFNDGSEVSYSEGYAVGNEAGLKYGEQIGIEEGKQAQYEYIRDVIQDYGNRTNYSYFLTEANYLLPWYTPKYDIRPTDMYMFFYFGENGNYGDLDIVEWCENAGIELDTSQCTNFMYAFCRGSRYGIIDPRYGASKDSGVLNKQVFFSNSRLHTIEELYVVENMTFNTYTFSGCSSLKNLKITGTIGNSITFYSCPLLKDSILSVFNALSPTAEGMTVTFKKTAVNTAFGINVDDETSYTDEWKSLTESKKNWSIAYA